MVSIKTIFFRNSNPIIITRDKAQDIDNEDDLRLLKTIQGKRKWKNKLKTI